MLKRHCGSLSELTDDEWNELHNLICKVETCLKTVRPRYDKPVVINGNTYIDSEFGHHYAMNKSGIIPDKDKEAVFNMLKEWLSQ